MIYNYLKLSEHHMLFHNKRALIAGSGAVGTYIAEYCAKLGVSPDALDFDFFTLENAAKHSCLVRTPEDAGRNKALVTAERLQPLLDEGCSANGIDTDLCMLGPEAFADYSIVFVAVDNFDAKVLINELIRQLPANRRPVVVMAGTYDEMAQSVIINNKDFCLRCLIDESWMKDSSVRTSCTGPQIRTIDGEPEIVRTSNVASSMAAHLAIEQFRSHVLNYDGVMNNRLTYTAYPHLELSASHPMRKRNCPGCVIHPPEEIRELSGTVLSKTLGETLSEVEELLGTADFEISVHRLNYRKIVYAGFIVSDVCRHCGKPISVLKHEGRAFLGDFFCEDCGNRKVFPEMKYSDNHASILHAFTRQCDENIKKMTLYDLGFPLGAHIEIVQRNGAFDFLDEDKITTTTFFCKEDPQQMHCVTKLL